MFRQARQLSLQMSTIKNVGNILFQSLMKNFDYRKDIDMESEPLLHSVMYSRQLSILLKLKQKAKILVAESAVLIGVVDELGILEENEVFVQLKRDSFRVEKEREIGRDGERSK